MKIPTITGVIDRRILVNYRVDPQVLVRILPAPFEPKLQNGYGMAGVCLIRLKHIRPRFFPTFVGIHSENAAHRIAVRWQEHGTWREGVYVPRRDTSSPLNTLFGGRIFPGVHHRSQFHVTEANNRYRVELVSNDDATHLVVDGKLAENLPDTSIFDSLQAASDFFEAGSLGYSTTRSPGQFDGLELRSFSWKVVPLDITVIESNFFHNNPLFPQGSVAFDCALLMRDIQHEWHARPLLYAT
ncbi:MAG: hypothetical protein GFH27_549289n80 [Chloroflexi bacterium AL-W]|nr:hypothetical protein [Chloroflexi bacterium AL-N1]NOK66812.1 hypothetical protein [Chloroflexi bacterium AL-N10]NOK74896.1 hypothetical protein [Chloroflexi bacterium AL-N5]NOK81415.1 hypothetical protein [Chloroflexi bacterium AL-W]NOK88884.1 hypothetical protein [Chloroflexi bacterium AL-N15]